MTCMFDVSGSMIAFNIPRCGSASNSELLEIRSVLPPAQLSLAKYKSIRTSGVWLGLPRVLQGNMDLSTPLQGAV